MQRMHSVTTGKKSTPQRAVQEENGGAEGTAALEDATGDALGEGSARKRVAPSEGGRTSGEDIRADPNV